MRRRCFQGAVGLFNSKPTQKSSEENSPKKTRRADLKFKWLPRLPISQRIPKMFHVINKSINPSLGPG
jgi:hypothetical protein